MEIWAWAALLGVWMAASSGCGFLLALLARRVHRGLDFKRLWAFYTALMGFMVAAVFLIGWF